MKACVFGAGGIKGAVYAKALANMREDDMPEPEKLAGVSIGALVAIAYATDGRRALLQELYDKVMAHRMVNKPFLGFMPRIFFNSPVDIDEACPYIKEKLLGAPTSGCDVKVAACLAGQDFPVQVEFRVCEGDKVSEADVKRAEASASVEGVFQAVELAEGERYCDGASGGLSMPMQSLRDFFNDGAVRQLWVFSTKPWVLAPEKPRKTHSRVCRLKSRLARGPRLSKWVTWLVPKALQTRMLRAWPAFSDDDVAQTQLLLGVGSEQELAHGVCVFERRNGATRLAATWSEASGEFVALSQVRGKLVVLVAPRADLYTYANLTFLSSDDADFSPLDAAADDMSRKLTAASRFVSSCA